MTQPQTPPNQGITTEQALAAIAAANALRTENDRQDTAILTIMAMSEAMATARDRAYTYAYSLIHRAWTGVNVYRGAEVQAFTETAGGYMATAQSAVAQTAAATQRQILGAMGVTVPPSAVPSDPVDVRGTPSIGADNVAVVKTGESHVDYGDGGPRIVNLDEDATTVGMFNRPARTQRYLESKGMGSVHARQEAEDRMSLLVGDNLMLVQRLAEAEVLAHAAGDTGIVDTKGRQIEAIPAEIIGYRRVIHPEKSRTGVCGLCIAASDRMYRVRELMPVHTNCKCTTAAVTAEFDPADVLNQADLKELYGLAGGTSGASLKRVKYSTDEHGELGPILVPQKPYKPRKSQPSPQRTAKRPVAPGRKVGV